MRGSVLKLFNLFIVFMMIFLSGCIQRADQIIESDTVTKKADRQGNSEDNDEISEFQEINDEDIAFLDEFVIPEYETICKDDNSIITESKDFFSGADTMWYTIENDGIVYFYYQYLGQDLQPISEPTYLNYAITGEQYTLRCGIHVGMTEEEVYELLPNCVICKPTDSEGVLEGGALTWNVSSFPEGWCESYDQILMANIEYGEELPWYLGIMTDKCGVVKAITTCYPTAG